MGVGMAVGMLKPLNMPVRSAKRCRMTGQQPQPSQTVCDMTALLQGAQGKNKDMSHWREGSGVRSTCVALSEGVGLVPTSHVIARRCL